MKKRDIESLKFFNDSIARWIDKLESDRVNGEAYEGSTGRRIDGLADNVESLLRVIARLTFKQKLNRQN